MYSFENVETWNLLVCLGLVLGVKPLTAILDTESTMQEDEVVVWQ